MMMKNEKSKFERTETGGTYSRIVEEEEGIGRKRPKWELGFWCISILYTFQASARARNTEIVMDNSGHNGRSGGARQTQRFLHLPIPTFILNFWLINVFAKNALTHKCLRTQMFLRCIFNKLYLLNIIDNI